MAWGVAEIRESGQSTGHGTITWLLADARQRGRANMKKLRGNDDKNRRRRMTGKGFEGKQSGVVVRMLRCTVRHVYEGAHLYGLVVLILYGRSCMGGELGERGLSEERRESTRVVVEEREGGRWPGPGAERRDGDQRAGQRQHWGRGRAAAGKGSRHWSDTLVSLASARWFRTVPVTSCQPAALLLPAARLWAALRCG